MGQSSSVERVRPRATGYSFRIGIYIFTVLLATAACGRRASEGPPVHDGQLVVSERSGPRTFNPALVTDNPSRTIAGLLFSDLIHINRQTQRTEPALASSWTVSSDGREYTLTLRPDLKFSDGHPCGVEDVLFTFAVYEDENVHAPQRDLLMVGGKPIQVRAKGEREIVFTLAEPYGAAERLFDGISILPKHRLAESYANGSFPQAWSVASAADAIVGTGPFRIREHVPGERLVLERNPYYWKRDAVGAPLPYLDRLIVVFTANEDAEVLRFRSGQIDVLNRLDADNFSALERESRADYQLVDAGPGLEYNFLLFNLNDPSTNAGRARRQRWFASDAFRHAISAAIDRGAIVRIVFKGRAEALWGPVTGGNRLWVNTALPKRPRSLDAARTALRSAGFSAREDGSLVDRDGVPVAFSLMVASSSAPRMQMATLVQDDLSELGMRVDIAPLEFRATVDRILNTKDYDAAIMGLVSGDADPNGDLNVWLSSGSTHMWRPSGSAPATTWEAEIDDLMRRQLVARSVESRKQLFDRVQAIISEHEPIVFLASPHILAAAKAGLAPFRPAILPHYTLWNVEELSWRPPSRRN